MMTVRDSSQDDIEKTSTMIIMQLQGTIPEPANVVSDIERSNYRRTKQAKKKGEC